MNDIIEYHYKGWEMTCCSLYSFRVFHESCPDASYRYQANSMVCNTCNSECDEDIWFHFMKVKRLLYL